MAQRRQRALGMLSSLGATEADVRFVLIIDGLVAGLAGAVLGAAVALGGWFWYYPHLETATAHRTDPLDLPWAARDHRPAARRRHLRHRRPLAGPGRQQGAGRGRDLRAGRAAAAGRPLAASPACIFRRRRPVRCCSSPAAGTAAARRPVPHLAGLLVLRDRVRTAGAVHRRRALPAGLARPPGPTAGAPRPGTIPVTVGRGDGGGLVRGLPRHDHDRSSPASGSTTRSTTRRRTWQSNQLILYAPGNDPNQYETGQFTPAAKLAATHAEADAIAAQLHAAAPLELDVAVSVERAGAGAADPEPVRRDHSPCTAGASPACSSWPPRRC